MDAIDQLRAVFKACRPSLADMTPQERLAYGMLWQVDCYLLPSEIALLENVASEYIDGRG